MKYHLFTYVHGQAKLMRMGEYETANLMDAMILASAQHKLDFYEASKTGDQEALGVYHLITPDGDIHWLDITGTHSSAWYELVPGRDELPLSWLINPLMERARGEAAGLSEAAKSKVDEVKDEIRRLRRELEEADDPHADIQSTLNTLCREIKEAVENIIDDTDTSVEADTGGPALDDAIETLKSMEDDLDEVLNIEGGVTA